MTRKSPSTVQKRFLTALKEKIKDYYSVEIFAEAVKLKPSLIVDIMNGKVTPDHAAMQNVASGVGYELMAFLDWGQELIEKQELLETMVADKQASLERGERAAERPKPEEGLGFKPVPVDKVIEDFGAWARKLAKDDPKMVVWLEKTVEILKKLTHPEFGRPSEPAKPHDVI
ncbi:MAG: hypothetical protein AB1896_20630 [Thermodesulfobacteriota bacterium]